MASFYTTSELRNGMKVMLDGSPCVIVQNEFVKPGKGQAFNRIKLKNLKTDRVLEKTYKSGDSLEAADVSDAEMQYLYNDGVRLHFMDTNTYEQIEISIAQAGDAAKWLKEQDLCTLTLWNNEVITVTPPIFVILKIVETDPGLRGDTVTGSTKPAKLETGAVVKVPLFVEQDEYIKIDTRTGEYIARAV